MTSRLAIALPCALLLAACPALASEAGQVRRWDFRVTLNDDVIGWHRFSMRANEPTAEMHGEADFAVKFLGLTVYRYRHVISSRWRGDCLASLDAHTDDDGTNISVSASDRDGGVLVKVAGGGAASRQMSGCLMDFAYWNLRMLEQTRLLNPQTGEVEPVRIARGRRARLTVHGQPVEAQAWRIEGRHEPIEVWYSAQGDWIGLDAEVNGGRMLSYRLP